jgi:hypothetical protein
VSEVLEEFTFRGPGRGDTRYPWDLWLDGRIHKLNRGEDFTITNAGFRGCVHKACSARGGSAKTQWDGDSLVIQFSKDES